MKRIVVFASGNGSNALNLIEHFNSGNLARVVSVFSNKKQAGVVQKALDKGVEVTCFSRSEFYDSNDVIEAVKTYKPDLIVLAGFLWLIPVDFLSAFDGLVINLHPSLLPKFGGKGMYGRHVHEAVLEAKEKQTGITVHFVNSEFDKGEIIYQDAFDIEDSDTVESIEHKIHELEFKGLPIAVERVFGK
ncbi:MAG: phosphoribosylglycinamide formyltransferase [Bacteroidia bacterium]